jgi:hypothetical protein
MAQAGKLLNLTSVAATDYIAAGAQNAAMNAAIVAGSLGAQGRGRVMRVTLRAAEAKIYDVLFFATNTYAAGATAATVKFLGRVNFAVADGVQVAAAGPFLFSAACDIPVRDEHEASRIYCTIVNRSVAALTGGASSLILELHVDLTSGG